MAGKSEAAAVLVQVVVKSDPPDMGGDIWKRRCQRLKRKCEEFEQVNNRGNFTKSSIIGWRYLARCELFMVLLTLCLADVKMNTKPVKAYPT